MLDYSRIRIFTNRGGKYDQLRWMSWIWMLMIPFQQAVNQSRPNPVAGKCGAFYKILARVVMMQENVDGFLTAADGARCGYRQQGGG